MRAMDSSTANIRSDFASQSSLDNSNNNANQGPLMPHQFKQHSNFDLNPHVRIHPTDMQRYLHNLIRNNENTNEAMSVNAFEKEHDESSGAAASAAFLTEGGNEPSNKRFKTGEGGINPDMLLDSASGSSAHRGSLESSTSATKSEEQDSSSIPKGKKKRPAPADAKGDNFKNVDVLHETKLIARFLTQTECAAYLRATPEAVSYHCSKGGGVCNGLVIRPSQPSSEPLLYGLFDGAEQHRPKERPQLNKESVKILREWLLSPEHIENPYPNQLEMSELVKRTGLDRTQLKHWFNNARKRILKPYLKENGQSSGATVKGKKSRIRKNSASDSDAITRALKTAASATKPAAASASALACNPFQDDGPTLTEADEMPRKNQSLFGNMDSFEGGVTLDALRNGALGNHLGGGSLLGPSPTGMAGIGLNRNNDQGGVGLPSLPGNTFASGLGGLRDTGLGGSLLGTNQEGFDPSPESTRSNAVFKQQVAAMAMDEANIAFQETESAYARAKDLYARSTHAKPEEDDPLVIEANSVAKKCQSVAVFKLKVSQRANEEAAKAYAKCGMGLNLDGGRGRF